MSEVSTHTTVEGVRPFLKWPGGKSRLLSELHARLPESFRCYREPFLGGGALYFSLQPEEAVLSDINPELINVYEVVQQDVERLIVALKKHRYEKDYFYEIRAADRAASFAHWSSVEKAARTIYLNKTCYNGLFRVNSRGQFNTPFGRYKNPKICDEAALRRCSEALHHVCLRQSSFYEVCKGAEEGDLVYFDPPYVPLSDTANFVSYAQDGFSLEHQEKLHALVCELDKRGVFIMLSNSACPFILDLYREFQIDIISAPRAISCRGKGRHAVQEVVVRNYML